jgi:hypothetical protein
VNVYPASIEAVLRRFPEIAEVRSTVSWTDSMRTLAIEVEAPYRDTTPHSWSRVCRTTCGPR